MAPPQKKIIVHRRSDSGRFTSEKYADKHPRTTERQTIKVHKKK